MALAISVTLRAARGSWAPRVTLDQRSGMHRDYHVALRQRSRETAIQKESPLRGSQWALGLVFCLIQHYIPLYRIAVKTPTNPVPNNSRVPGSGTPVGGGSGGSLIAAMPET